MKVVVDTNIVFASLRTLHSTTRNRLLSRAEEWYAPLFMFEEIFEHKEDIRRRSQLSDRQTTELLGKILRRLNFFNEELISEEAFIEAYHLCKGIDTDDIPFVALTLELDARLWSRDERLKTHLRAQGFDRFYEEPNG